MYEKPFWVHLLFAVSLVSVVCVSFYLAKELEKKQSCELFIEKIPKRCAGYFNE